MGYHDSDRSNSHNFEVLRIKEDELTSFEPVNTYSFCINCIQKLLTTKHLI